MNTELFFTFLSLHSSATLRIQGDEKALMHIMSDLLYVFESEINDDTKKIFINPLLKYNENIKNDINEFISHYKNISPVIFKMREFFKKLSADELFYFLPFTKELTLKQYILTRNELLCHINEWNLSDLNEVYEKNLGSIFDKYHIRLTATDKKTKIGEGLKKLRVCRFCNKKHPETTYNQEAHAISESLGNKTIFLNEECDNCNKLFSETIERDIDAYLKILTVFFKVKNKKGKISTIKGKNFTFSYDCINNEEHLTIKLKSDNDTSNQLDPPTNIPLEFNEKITLQNIYKSLVKFSLSVIDNTYLDKFKKTVEWITTNQFFDALPKIAILSSYHAFTIQPEMIVYLRSNNNINIPYAVGEFRCTYLIFAFIIPTFDEDSPLFLSENEYQEFWSTFTHYHNFPNWQFQDFSNFENKEFIFNMNFQKTYNK